MSLMQTEYQQERANARQELTSMFCSDILMENVSDATMLIWAHTSCEIALSQLAVIDVAAKGPIATKVAYLLREAAMFAALYHFVATGELFDYYHYGAIAPEDVDTPQHVMSRIKYSLVQCNVLHEPDVALDVLETRIAALADGTASALMYRELLGKQQVSPPEALILNHLKLTRAAYF